MGHGSSVLMTGDMKRVGGNRALMLGLILLYFVLCLITGLLGINRAMGYFGATLLSVLVTPLIAIIIIKLTAPRQKVI